MKRGVPCRHCGSPARDNPCWFKRPNFTKRDLPPCALDRYRESITTSDRHAMLRIAGVVLVALVLWVAAAAYRFDIITIAW